MTFKILDINFSPSVARVNYATITQKHREIAFPLARAFEKEFDENIHSADEAVKKMNDMSAKYIANAISEVISYLCQYDVYSEDVESFLSRLEDAEGMAFWDEECQDIIDKYNEIVGTAEGEKAYREARKDSRGRVVGGGFGINGAVKGMATAGAINMATGMAHSVFNAFGNMATDHQANKEKEKLLATIGHRLGIALYVTIVGFSVVTMKILQEEEVCSFDYPSAGSVSKASSLISNLVSKRVPEERIPTVVNQILTLNPFDEKLYEYLLHYSGDADGTIERLGEELCIDVQEMKESMLEEAISSDLSKLEKKYENKLDKTGFEQELLELQTRLDVLKSCLGFDGRIELEDQLEEDLDEAIEISRTVEDVVFDTPEEAEKAKKDLVLFETFIKQNGIFGENIRQQISQLPFQTTIVLDTLDERLEEIREASDPTDIPDRVMDIFQECCFYDTTVNRYMTKDTVMKQLFIPGVSANAEQVLNEARSYVPVRKEETIAFIMRGKALVGDKYSWFIMGNINLYLFQTKKGQVTQKSIVRYMDVDEVRFNRLSELTISCKDGTAYSLDMSLSGIDFTQSGGAEDMMEAFSEIMSVLMPITQGRDTRVAAEETVQSIKLDLSVWIPKFSKIRNDSGNTAKFDSCVAFAGASEKFDKLLLDQTKFWNTQFKNETIYLMIHNYIRGSLYAGILLTDKALYQLKSGQVSKSKRILIGMVKKSYLKGFMETFTVETHQGDFSVEAYDVPSKSHGPLAKFLDELIQALRTETAPEQNPVSSTLEPVKSEKPDQIEAKAKTFEERISALRERYDGNTFRDAFRDCCNRYTKLIREADGALLCGNDRKLREKLGVPYTDYVYLAVDATVFSSGKEGFAITDSGFYCRSGGTQYSLLLRDLRDYRNIKWDGGKLYMRSRLLAYVLGSNAAAKDLLKTLYEDIAMLSAEVFPITEAQGAAVQTAPNTPSGNPAENVKELSMEEKENSSITEKAAPPSLQTVAAAETEPVNEATDPSTEEEPTPETSEPAAITLSERREKIKQVCKATITTSADKAFLISSKIIKGLNLNAYGETYIVYDATLFNSGKNGFAFTSEGVVCRLMLEKEAHLVTYDELAKARLIYWTNQDKTELWADDKPVLYTTGLSSQSRDVFKQLVDKIVEIARMPIVNAVSAEQVSTVQQTVRYCATCGAKITEGSRFCSCCGTPVSSLQ